MKITKYLFIFLTAVFFINYASPLQAASIEKPAGRIVSLSGSVTVKKGTTASSARPFQNLDAGDVVITGPNSRVAILLRDESLIKLNSNSQITINNVLSAVKPVSTGADDKTQIRHDTGEMWIRTKNRPGKLEIDTKSGSAAIRGTEFNIYADENKTLLTLVDGVAELSNSLGSVTVSKNEQGEATPNSAPVKRTLTIEETDNAVQWIFYFPKNLNLKQDILDTTLDVLTKNYQEKPNESEPKTFLGIKKLISGKYEEALKLFDEANSVNPASATNHLMKARTLFVLHKQKEALKEIDEAIKLEPSWYLPKAEKSKFLIAQGDLIPGEKEAKEAIKLDSNSPESWISLGETQYAFGKVKASKESFDKAINIDSNFAEAHIGKGRALISQFHNNEAIDEFLSAVLLEPGLARAHLYLGQAYYQNRETEKAINEIKEAMRIDPKDPLVLNSLSIIYDVAHQYGKALELDEKTIEITPNLLESGARQSRNLSVASGNLGIEPLRFGLTDWAFFQANKALRENPIDGASHFTLGTIYSSNKVQPVIPKGEGAGASQAQLSTGQVRGLRGTNLTGINARTSTNEYDLGLNFASDSERTIGKLLAPSIIGSPNGRYRFFRAPELYVTTDGLFGQQQISVLNEGSIMANGYLGTPWNLYLNTEFMGGLVRDVLGDLTGKGNRSFFKSDFAFSPLKTLDVIGSYTRADVNMRVFDKKFPAGRSLFTPDLNDFDVALNWHPNTHNVILNRFFSEISSTRLDSSTPELGKSMIFAGIFPRNYGYQIRHLSNFKKQRFTWGSEWIRSVNPAQVSTNFFSTGIIPPVQTIGYLKERSHYDILTAYTQDLFRVNPRTDLVLGFRYDQIFQRTNDNTFTQTLTDSMSSVLLDFDKRNHDRVSFSPQVGVAYNLGTNTVLRLGSQHKAFYNTFLPELAPQDVAGLPFGDQGEFFTRGTEGWEHAASLEHRMPQIVSWLESFVKFKPFYRRMLVRNFDSLASYQVQRVRAPGFEVSYNQLMFKQVGFFASYVYQHIRDRTPYKIFDDLTSTLAIVNGKIPTLQVPNRMRFGWTWHSPSGFSLNYINTYIGPKFGTIGEKDKIRGYLLGDLNLSYESPRTKSYLVTFGVNNLYGAAFRQSIHQRDPGITFYGNFELRGVLPFSGYFWK
ncbi:MAG: tetratricopeptide repeat protein [Candidatus Melainabacteria bacterium]|nr:tetratricopeptide repeat protein [Candidatus Melainabacteria bacterium]